MSDGPSFPPPDDLPPPPPPRPPQGASSWTNPPEPDEDHSAALAAVRAPAITMIVFSGISALYSAGSFLFLAAVRDAMTQAAQENPQLKQMADLYRSPLFETALGAGIVLCAISIVGAVRMLQGRSYALAMIAVVLFLVNVLGTCCCLVNIGVGIWALVVLLRDDVQRAFNRP